MHIAFTNAVTRWIGHDLQCDEDGVTPAQPYIDMQIRVLAAARDDASTLELAAAIAQIQSDLVYMNRVVDGLSDTGDYIDTMISEYGERADAMYDQANDESDLDDIVRCRVLAAQMSAKFEAYRDCARVLAIPFDHAFKMEESDDR